MNNNESRYQQIEDYINNRLDKQGLEAFEKEMLSDPDLKEMVDLERASNEAIFQNRMMNLRGEFNQEFEQIRTKRKIKIITGVVALVAVTTAILYFSTQNEQQPKSILNSENLDTTREISKEIPERVTPALVLEPKQPHSEESLEASSSSSIPEKIAEKKEVTITPKELIVKDKIDTEVVKDNNEDLPDNNISPPAATTLPCPKITIEGMTQISVCEGMEGSTKIKALGGEKPYRYYLDDNKLDSPDIEYLGMGEYELLVKDANNCLSETTNIVVTEKYCFEPEKSFSPEEEAWVYETDGVEVELQIFSKQGQEIVVIEGIDPSWDGTNSAGQLMPTDAYIYIIKDLDDTPLTGTVTLVR